MMVSGIIKSRRPYILAHPNSEFATNSEKAQALQVMIY